MADKTLKAQLIAEDKMSPVFKKAGDSAKTLGESLEDVGDSGKVAAKSLDDAGKSGKDAAKSLDDAGKSADDLDKRLQLAYKGGQQLGIGLLGLAAASTVAGSSYRDQQIEIDNLERSYGSASDQILEFANHLQDTTNYSNDAAVAAANTAATLARNYGFTADEIQRVLQISADLAATSGLGLEDATQRVTAALRGEAEGAEALGLTMNQAAIDSNNLTLSMSNQEAGHYRLNALITQSAFAQGAAAQQADGAYGTYKNLADSLQDLGQRYGGALGPIGEFGALIADHPKEAIAAAAAFKTLQVAIQGVNAVAGSATGKGLAQWAIQLGPKGVIVAGAIAAGIGIYKLASSLREEYVPSAQESIAASGQLAAAIREVAASSLDSAALGTKWSDNLEEIATKSDDLTARSAELQASISEIWGDQYLNLRPLSSDLTAVTMAVYGQASVLEGLSTQYAVSAEDAARFGEAEIALANVVRDGGAGREQAIVTVNALFAAYDRGEITLTHLLDALIAVGDNLDEFDSTAIQASIAAQTFEERIKAATQSTEGWMDAGGDFHKWLDDNLTISLQELGQASVELGPMLDTGLTAFEEHIKELTENTEGFLDAGGNFTEWVDDDLAKSMAAMGAASTQVRLFGQELQDFRQFGEGFTFNFGFDTGALGKFDIQPIVDRVVAALDQIPTAAEAMDNVFQSIVGNTDSIGSSAQAIEDWAAGFTDASEGVSRLDSILDTNNTLTSAATINQEQYNAALDAFNTIGQENAEIQQDIAVIQAKQAPLIAEQVEQTENYLNALADMPAAQQAIALGYMDATQSVHALELQQLALDAAMGKLGANGKDFATQIITGAVEADGQLKLMLEDMGLISVGADGTITVNFDDNASDGLGRLNDTVEKLAYTQILIAVGIENKDEADAYFEQLFGHAAEWDDTETTATADLSIDHALEGFDEAQSRLADWDRSNGTADADADNSGAESALADAESRLAAWNNASGTASVNAADNATNVINSVWGALRALDGSSATVFVNSVSSGAVDRQLQHGGIPGYAHGGLIPVELAEGNRPELLHFANGGTMPVFNNGIYDVPPHTYVSPNNTGTAWGGNVTIHVDLSGAVVNGYDDFRDRITTDISKAWQRANSLYERGQGW